MERYIFQQRIETIRIYHEDFLSVRGTFRTLHEIYGQHHRSTEGTTRRIVRKFETTDSVVDQPTPVDHRNPSSNENIAAFRESVNEGADLSILRRAQELGLSQSSTWRILHEDLGLFPYKIQSIQEQKPNEHLQRRQFADLAQEQLEIYPNFGKKRSSFVMKLIFG